MSMICEQCFLSIDEDVYAIPSLDELVKASDEVLKRPMVNIALEIRKGREPARWERIIYPLLGLKIPRDFVRLSISVKHGMAFVILEDGDSEWLIKLPRNVGSERIRFQTEVGEPFDVGRDECVPVEIARSLLCEFSIKGKRPSSVDWRKSG